MKESGIMVRLSEEENSIMLMEIFTKANGSITKPMASEYISMQRVLDMKDNGKTISSTAKESKSGTRVLSMMATMSWVKRRASENTHGLMGPPMKESGSRTK